jgi:hypothetical protein
VKAILKHRLNDVLFHYDHVDMALSSYDICKPVLFVQNQVGNMSYEMSYNCLKECFY